MAKSILITGCSSGIGAHAARTLHAHGWRVFATVRQHGDVAALVDDGLESFVLDYADTNSVEAGLAEALRRTGGTLDAVFNNGAFGLPGAVEDLPRDGLRSAFETNLFGVHDLTRRAIAVMRAQGHGRIIQNSSVLGFVGLKWRGAYVATKFALEGLTDVLRLEMADTPIKIILIEPGPITSEIRKKSIPHFEKWIDWEGSARVEQYREGLIKRLYRDAGPDTFELPPDAVTRKLIRALEAENPKARYYVTTPTYVMSFARRLLPSRALDWILSKS